MTAREETAAGIPEAAIETDKYKFFARTDLAQKTMPVRGCNEGVSVDTKVIFVTVEEGARIPEYHSSGAAGMDLRAFLPQPLTIQAGSRALVRTGLRLQIPDGYEAQVRPRSGLALEHGITCLNSPGTIDSDYRGEVCVLLINLGNEPFVVKNGDRIAQLVVAPYTRATIDVKTDIAATNRGSGGFGSTGIS